MESPVPVEIRTAAAGALLEVAWSDGAASRIASHRLRETSRSAQTTRARLAGRDAAGCTDVRIVGVEAVGLYAINIRFSDGYDRGIYPWRSLRELGECDNARR
jgi:DUF971 family protein